jgi:pyruvate,water dikinase
MTRTCPPPSGNGGCVTVSDAEMLDLARMAKTIEAHYGLPMDMEWARTGSRGSFSSCRPGPKPCSREKAAMSLQNSQRDTGGPRDPRGLPVGGAAATGRACLIQTAADIDKFVDGSILVTSMTDPDWVPIMKRASAIVTDHGGRTSHAAIVSRELGLPAIVGTGNATHDPA